MGIDFLRDFLQTILVHNRWGAQNDLAGRIPLKNKKGILILAVTSDRNAHFQTEFIFLDNASPSPPSHVHEHWTICHSLPELFPLFCAEFDVTDIK